ncbi:hypothetical protein [Nocardioides pyridinolyticus]
MTIDLDVALGVPTDDSFELLVNPEAAAELRAALEEAGLEVSSGMGHADPSGKPKTILYIGAVTAALPAVAKVLEVVLHRHDKKRFTITGEKVDAAGYSGEEILAILQQLEASRDATRDEWRKATGIEDL